MIYATRILLLKMKLFLLRIISSVSSFRRVSKYRFLTSSLLFLLLLQVPAFSQKPTKLWFFGWHAGGGSSAGMDFSGGAPVQMNGITTAGFYEGTTVQSDESAILFYSNGHWVRNINHVIMPNGSGLTGSNGPPDGSACQGAVSFPYPGSSSKYILITPSAIDGTPGNGIRWTEIDMTLDAGKGDVTANKDIKLTGGDQVTEMIGVYAVSCNEFWVVGHEYSSNNFIVIHVTAGGPQAPVKYAVGPNISAAGGARGSIKISPDGKKLVMVGGWPTGMNIFDFNAVTGAVSNHVAVGTVAGMTWAYGAEWSPNSRYVFMGGYTVINGIVVYDVQTSTGASVTGAGLYGVLQMGPDGVIYVAPQNNGGDLSTISNPNNGAAATFTSNGYAVGGVGAWLGLPQSYTCPSAIPCGDTTLSVSIPNLCTAATTFDLDSYIGTSDPGTWSISGGPGGYTATVAGDGHTFNVNRTLGGTYTVRHTLTTVNPGCPSYSERTFKVFDLPSVTLVLADDKICKNETAQAITVASPVGGTFSGAGVSGANYNAVLTSAGAHTITYTYTDGNSCTNTATDVMTVFDSTALSFVLADDKMCVNEAVQTITLATPAGGTFSGSGVSGVNYNPALTTVGLHTITYTLVDVNSCTSTATDVMTVLDTTAVSLILADDQMCKNESAQAITLASPVGGTFSGSGVSGNNYDPSSITAGPHTITYTFVSVNTCTSKATDVMTVLDTTAVSLILADDQMCKNESAQAITLASPAGGTFSGAGVSGNNYDPSSTTAGTHTISYTLVNGNTCISKATDVMTVLDTTAVSLILADDQMCKNEDPQAITVASPAGGTFSGAGVSGNNYDPSSTTAGPHTITYTFVSVNTCTSKATDVMTVLDTTAVSLILADDQMCKNESAQAITLASPAGGTFSGAGVSGNNYDPGATTAGPHTISYTLVNGNSCTSKATDVMTVLDTTAVSLILTDDQMCKNESAQAITLASPAGGTFSGSGVSGNNYDPGATTAGLHTIVYTLVSVNTCTSIATDVMTVFDTTALSFVLTNDKMCKNTMAQNIVLATPSGGVFSGQGVNNGKFDPSLVSAGTHTIVYTFVDGNTCVNKASAVMTVLDTTAASLLLGDDQMCINDPAQAIAIASPVGGVFSGLGVNGNNYDPALTVAGTHTIAYTFVNADNCTSTAKALMTVNALPVLTLADTSVCPGGSIALTPSPANFVKYEWNSNPLLNGATLNYNLPNTQVWVKVTNAKGCVDSAFATIAMGDTLHVDFGADREICTYEALTLNAAQYGPFAAPVVYTWDNVVGNSTKTIKSSGQYGVLVMDGRGCAGSDTMVLTVRQAPKVSLGSDTTVCFTGHEVWKGFVTDTFATIKWSTGSTDSAALLEEIGDVSVLVTNQYHCAAADTLSVKEFCKPMPLCFPNVMTPNGDGMNDVFTPCIELYKKIDDGNYKGVIDNIIFVSFVVYDRWGIKVNQTLDVIPKWDGTFQGRIVANGTYYYVVRYSDSSKTNYEQTGYITLLTNP